MACRGCKAAGLGVCIALAAHSSACKREERQARPGAAGASLAEGVSNSALAPGPTVSVAIDADVQDSRGDAKAGETLYLTLNCVGCHAHGGGGIGPALMDDRWTYGGDPDQIFATIIEGRPNGMPSFRGKVADQQVWHLVAYVRSLQRFTVRAPLWTSDPHLPAEERAR